MEEHTKEDYQMLTEQLSNVVMTLFNKLEENNLTVKDHNYVDVEETDSTYNVVFIERSEEKNTYGVNLVIAPKDLIKLKEGAHFTKDTTQDLIKHLNYMKYLKTTGYLELQRKDAENRGLNTEIELK